MAKTKHPTKLADLAQSLRLFGAALAETAALRTSVFLERFGILSPPPVVRKTHRHSHRRRPAH